MLLPNLLYKLWIHFLRIIDLERANAISDFRFTYYDTIQDALMEGDEQNMELFSILLKDDRMNKELISVFLEDTYNNLNILNE